MQYSIERSVVVDSQPATIRPHLEDLANWQAWSPWFVLEPTAKQSLKGKTGELGSSMSWAGDVIGSGRLTLIAKTDVRKDYDLAFFSPWNSEAKTSFTLTPLGDQTRVSWVMDAAMPFFLFFMIDVIKAMVGMDYNRGLTMLKSVVETGDVDAQTSSLGIVDYQGFKYLGLPRTSHMADLPEDMSADFEKIMRACSQENFEPEHVVSVYNKVKMSKQMFSYTSAISADGGDQLRADLPLIEGEIPSQNMLEIKHRGSYRYIGNAWAMGHMILRAKKIKHKGSPFEYYHNDPTKTPENELLTSIYLPVKV